MEIPLQENSGQPSIFRRLLRSFCRPCRARCARSFPDAQKNRSYQQADKLIIYYIITMQNNFLPVLVSGAGAPAGVPFLCTACGGIDSRTPARLFYLRTGPGITGPVPGWQQGPSRSPAYACRCSGFEANGRSPERKLWILPLPVRRWSGMITMQHDRQCFQNHGRCRWGQPCSRIQ